MMDIMISVVVGLIFGGSAVIFFVWVRQLVAQKRSDRKALKDAGKPV